MDAKQVPLRELLASVPADARLVIDDADGKGTRFIPVGRLCQEAAAALAEPEGGGNLPPPLPKDFDHGIGADRFKVVRGAFWWHVLIGDSPTEHGKFRSRASAEKMAADLLREFRNGAFVQHEAALAEPCPCDDRPAAQCPGEWEPGCDLGNNPKYAKRVEMTPKELAASIKRGEKWKVAEPGSLMIAAQQFLEWNRAQSPPPVTVGFELGVFEAVKKLYPAPPQRPAEPAQPVAWMHNLIDDNIITHRPADIDRHPDRWTALYPEPKPCPTCEALARTVMMDQTGYDTAPPQRKPLTEDEIAALTKSYPASSMWRLIVSTARAVERAHHIT